MMYIAVILRYRCSLVGLGQADPQGERDGVLTDLEGHADAVPADGRRYWLGALYRFTGLFKMGGKLSRLWPDVFIPI